MLVSVGLHFTPDGVSRPAALVTINMELLTEFRAHNFNWASTRACGFYGTRDAGRGSTASVKGMCLSRTAAEQPERMPEYKR